MNSRSFLLAGVAAAVLATSGVAAADGRPSSVAGTTYCGSIANPCPDQWFLLIDGTTIVTRDVPAAPFSGGAPPVVGRGRPIEA